MSREEVTAVVAYCEEHNVTYKARLEELSIPYWKFHDAKWYYSHEDRLRSSGEGSFIRLGEQPAAPRSHHKKIPVAQSFEASSLSVELQTPGGTLMRIQGEMSASVLKEIIMAANGYVQP